MKRTIIVLIFSVLLLPFNLMGEDEFDEFKVDVDYKDQQESNKTTEQYQTQNSKKIQGKINSYLLSFPDNGNLAEKTKITIEFTDNYGDLFFYIKGNINHFSLDTDNRKGEDIRGDLVEAYIDYSKFISQIELNLRIGQQIINWGKADEIRPTDILSPQDLRLLILEERNDRKLGRIALKGSIGYKSLKLEGFFFPIHKESLLPIEENSPFLSPIIKEIKESDPLTTIEKIKVKDRISDSDFAGKLYFNLFNTDISLSYYRGYDPTPFTEFNLSEKKIELFLNRIEFIGFDFERVLGSFVVRGEVAYFTKGMLFKKVINNIEKEYLDLTLGIDKTDFLIPNLYINLQYNLNYIKDYEEGLLSRYGTKLKEYNHSGIYTVYYEFDNLRYRIELKGNYSFTNKDGLLSPSFHMKLGPQTKLIIGSYILFGEKDTYIGQYNNKDFIYLKLEHLF
ncbi:MAG TPA: hypothetical protein PKW55_04830 [Spirochaetota bacterium]|nr:hypothetical protein [Spirochaetota bacterium]HOM37724.1 hypothetical protein [Spirochaetota bacterium]HPQ49682.1 hypothetical protein [Spirochaetota bacterium]